MIQTPNSQPMASLSITLIRIPLLIIASLASISLLAQDEPTVLGDEVILDFDAAFSPEDSSNDSSDELVFDDPFASVFDAPFDDSAASSQDRNSNTPEWLSGFTVKLTQQILFQTKTHDVNLRIPQGPVITVPQEADVETNRLAANVRYQFAFTPGWLLQASGFARVFLHDDYEFEALDKGFDTEFRLNEFFIQRSFDQHSVKLGNQTVVWGEVDGNSVLDVINVTEFRDFSIIDIEDARLNQPMLVWDYFGDRFGERSRLSTFVTLYPEYNPPIVRGSPFFVEPAFNITDYKRTASLEFEGGMRWSRSFEGSDIALMAAYLIENQLSYSNPAELGQDALSTNNAFSLVGFSANRALGNLLLNLDVAYSRGILVNNLNIPGVAAAEGARSTRNQLGTSVGVEYAINNEQNIALSVQLAKPLAGKAQTPIQEESTGAWLMRYSNSLMNGDLALALGMQGDIHGEFTILQASADRTLNDRWAMGLNLILLDGVETSPISLFAGDIRLGFNLTYSF